jgi:hypothetical protein
LDIKEGAIVGLDDQFSSVDGDSKWRRGSGGTQYAIADAVGMKDPGNENSFGVTNHRESSQFGEFEGPVGAYTS